MTFSVLTDCHWISYLKSPLNLVPVKCCPFYTRNVLVVSVLITKGNGFIKCSFLWRFAIIRGEHWSIHLLEVWFKYKCENEPHRELYHRMHYHCIIAHERTWLLTRKPLWLSRRLSLHMSTVGGCSFCGYSSVIPTGLYRRTSYTWKTRKHRTQRQ